MPAVLSRTRISRTTPTGNRAARRNAGRSLLLSPLMYRAYPALPAIAITPTSITRIPRYFRGILPATCPICRRPSRSRAQQKPIRTTTSKRQVCKSRKHLVSLTGFSIAIRQSSHGPHAFRAILRRPGVGPAQEGKTTRRTNDSSDRRCGDTSEEQREHRTRPESTFGGVRGHRGVAPRCAITRSSHRQARSC